jgi:FkbM family methyltransferase
MLRRLFSAIERAAATHGYRISWIPSALFETPRAELMLNFEYAAAHLTLAKKDIFFIQIGANDGITTDPIYPFVTHFGWRGILVEPQPDVFTLLKENYAGRGHLKFINAAISERDGRRTLYTVRAEKGTIPRVDRYSSFYRDVVAGQTRWVSDVADRIEEVEVDCLSLNSLLRETDGNDVDVLHLDVEGYDYDILQMIDFKTMNPSLICFEHANMDKAKQEQVAKLLVNQGYGLSRDDLDTVAYRPVSTYGWR